MLTPSGWTVLVLKKLRIRLCSGSKSYPCVGEAEGYYTRLLWTIPEEEEDTSHKGEHLIFKLRKKPAIKASPGRVGGDCHCSLLMKCTQLKSHFTASLKTMHKTAGRSNGSDYPKTEGNNISSSTWSKSSSRAIAPATHRSKADEDELRQQCKEIYELYRAIAEGRLSLEKILNLRL